MKQTRYEEALYQVFYDLAYYRHKYAKTQPNLEKYYELLADAGDVELIAIIAGSSEFTIDAIVQRSELDVLLALSKDGFISPYRECYMVVEPGNKPGRYVYTIGAGDVSPTTQESMYYCGLNLEDSQIALHIYRTPGINAEQAKTFAFRILRRGKFCHK